MLIVNRCRQKDGRFALCKRTSKISWWQIYAGIGPFGKMTRMVKNLMINSTRCTLWSHTRKSSPTSICSTKAAGSLWKRSWPRRWPTTGVLWLQCTLLSLGMEDPLSCANPFPSKFVGWCQNGALSDDHARLLVFGSAWQFSYFAWWTALQCSHPRASALLLLLPHPQSSEHRKCEWSVGEDASSRFSNSCLTSESARASLLWPRDQHGCDEQIGSAKQKQPTEVGDWLHLIGIVSK